MAVSESTLNWPVEVWDDFITDTYDNVKGGLQQKWFTKFFTDIYGLGKDGGALDGKIANEIIYKNFPDRIEILGFRKYNDEKGEAPISSLDEIEFEDGEIKAYKSGDLIKKQLRELYDTDFGMLGAEGILTKGQFGKAGEETDMREEFIRNAIRYYTRPSGKGKDLGNGISVVEVPHKGNWWQRMDKGLVAYYLEGAANYYVMTWASKKFRKALAWAGGFILPNFITKYMRDEEIGPQSEERLRRQYIRFTDNRNKRWGVNKRIAIRY